MFKIEKKIIDPLACRRHRRLFNQWPHATHSVSSAGREKHRTSQNAQHTHPGLTHTQSGPSIPNAMNARVYVLHSKRLSRPISKSALFTTRITIPKHKTPFTNYNNNIHTKFIHNTTLIVSYLLCTPKINKTYNSGQTDGEQTEQQQPASRTTTGEPKKAADTVRFGKQHSVANDDDDDDGDWVVVVVVSVVALGGNANG